jgi:hypothetical protein
MIACFVLAGVGVALAVGLLGVFVLPRPQTKVGGDRRVDRTLAGGRAGESSGRLSRIRIRSPGS